MWEQSCDPWDPNKHSWWLQQLQQKLIIKAALEYLDKYYLMELGSNRDPDVLFRAKLHKIQLENGVFAWGMSFAKYVKHEVENVQDKLDKQYPGWKLAKFLSGPTNYNSELDINEQLDPKCASYY